MERSRTSNSLISMGTGLAQKLVSIMVGFFSQWILIHYLGMEYLSLDGLFANTLSFLALMDLGIGSTLTVYLYKPLALKDVETIKSYARFYRRAYNLIGFIVLAVGLLLLPFVNSIIHFDNDIGINIYRLYILYLLNTCTSYWFRAYKTSIFVADQKSYLIHRNDMIFGAAGSIVKSLIIILTRMFEVGLLVEIITNIIKNLYVSNRVDRQYPFLREHNAKPLDVVVRKSLFRDVRAIFINKVGSNLLNATDNLIISGLLATILIGHTAMYTRITNYIVMIVGVLTTSMVASVGNLHAKENVEKQIAVFGQLNLFNFWLSCISAACLFNLLTPFIAIFYGSDNDLQSTLISQQLVGIMVFNFYLSTSANIIGVFKSASGLLRQGCYLALFGGVLNIALDYILAPRLGLAGVYVATTISSFTTIYCPKAIYLYKDGFKISPRVIVIKLLKQIFVLGICMLLTTLSCSWIKGYTIYGFIVRLIITVLVSNGFLLLIYHRSSEFKALIARMPFERFRLKRRK